jgi:hypothetical protein
MCPAGRSQFDPVKPPIREWPTVARSWTSRLRGSIKSVTAGVGLVLVALPAMWCNEGSAVSAARSLDEGAGAVVSVSRERVDPGHEGHLVHVSGLADTAETLTDPDFGVSARAIRLVRTAEMYQWEEAKRSETRRGPDGQEETVETVSYEKVWSEKAIDSRRFEEAKVHPNPGGLPLPSRTFVARSVTLGAFTLPASLVERLKQSQPLPVAEEAPRPRWTGTRLVAGGFYRGADPARPTIGDVRVRFSVVRPQAVSVVARQFGQTFAPYPTRAGNDLLMLTAGEHPAASMFATERAANALLDWMLRAALIVLTAAGLWLVLRPIAVLGSAVPFVGSLLGAGLGVVSLALAAVLGLLTIGTAWLFYRPAVAAAAIGVAAAALALLRRRARRRAATPR